MIITISSDYSMPWFVFSMTGDRASHLCLDFFELSQSKLAKD